MLIIKEKTLKIIKIIRVRMYNAIVLMSGVVLSWQLVQKVTNHETPPLGTTQLNVVKILMFMKCHAMSYFCHAHLKLSAYLECFLFY